jgi:hypothetical protein
LVLDVCEHRLAVGGLFGALLRIPESPRWLLSRGRRQQAFGILKRINGETSARREILEIGRSLAKESGSFGELLTRELRSPLCIAVALAVLSQATGINTVIYYGSIFLKEHAGRTIDYPCGRIVLKYECPARTTVLGIPLTSGAC